MKLRSSRTGDEWVELDVPAPGGADAEADLLARLTHARVTVARLERVPPSLADLLQRAIARADEGGAGVREYHGQPAPGLDTRSAEYSLTLHTSGDSA